VPRTAFKALTALFQWYRPSKRWLFRQELRRQSP
jgi:hypothetical protein